MKQPAKARINDSNVAPSWEGDTSPISVSGVMGVVGSLKEQPPSSNGETVIQFPSDAADAQEVIWNDDDPPGKNYDKLGARLADSGDLFRRPQYGDGMILVLDKTKTVNLTRGADLAPVIVDRVRVRVLKDGKPKGGQIAAAHLNAMLRSNRFLDHFLVVDQVSAQPLYLSDFSLTRPGYNDGGEGNRILYLGDGAAVSPSLNLINTFLDEMAFATIADRTNAAAALLTVLLRHHWPGGKPIIIATATKSHAGKDTVILFAAGVAVLCAISYQATNWALERSFVGALNNNPNTGVLVVENARLDRRDRMIASAFLERFATDPEPLLFSTGTGRPVRRHNDICLAISTNYGSVSEDLMNRALPIHLNPTGNVADRESRIGNPKLEYLPANREGIVAEARGMIERWKAAGQPLDSTAKHPFSVWARTIGGILKANGFDGFLANYHHRKTADDPLREAIGLLGAELPDQWHRPATWAEHIAKLGLTKRVIPVGDQDSAEGRKRGVGVILSAHRDETFEVETDEEIWRLRLEKKRGRFGDEAGHVRYRFVVLDRRGLEDSND